MGYKELKSEDANRIDNQSLQLTWIIQRERSLVAHMEKKKLKVFVCHSLDFCVARSHMKEPTSSWQRSNEMLEWQKHGWCVTVGFSSWPLLVVRP